MLRTGLEAFSDPGSFGGCMNKTTDEWFDVVNARDEVVGRETRRVVHATGLWHRAVHVLVFDAAGRIFLQKRSMKKIFLRVYGILRVRVISTQERTTIRRPCAN